MNVTFDKNTSTDGKVEVAPAELLRELNKATAGKPMSIPDRVTLFRKFVEQGGVHTMEPLLPILLTLKGKPYTLEDHFPFAPLFRTRKPSQLMIKSGRQVSKSTSIAANAIVTAVSKPFFAILFVTPLYEQVRRLSNNYVRPFIDQSPVKSLWIGTSTENSVLQRSFKNQARLYFSFALLDADRVRGISADVVAWDEAQDMDPDLVPIVKEVMSHSEWGLSWFTGTPKTEDNIMESLWQSSSQAEWFIRCDSCSYWNIPSKEYDIVEMMGPLRDDISEENPATLCRMCQKPINPKKGRWVHRYREKRWDFAGYHIPQIIMPLHYGSRKKWSELLAKRSGSGNTTKAQFYNEVLGESFDESTKLITVGDLKGAAVLPWKNNPDNHSEIAKKVTTYIRRCLAVDWGGGGKDETSFTTMAILGWRNDGGIDVIWGKRSLIPHDHIAEAELCLKLFNDFRCHFIAHDYTGAGSLRETFIHHAGVPMNKIIPISYVRTGQRDIMQLHVATRQHPRDYHLLDKARSLQLTCNAIKLKYIKFFAYDFIDKENPGLLHDFLALIENKVDTAHAGDIYTIVRNPLLKDDFAQAVNIGACALWHATSSWPNIAHLSHLQLSSAQLASIAPSPDQTWMGRFLEGP